MNVYKRPLFMQQGGMARVPVPTPPAAMRPATAPSGAMPPMRPASAPMGAPGAPPRPPAQDVAGIASMVSQKGQMELDQAQGPEQIINAFRGNQKPLEARYQELAQYVGPQDAAATPLSVLTMVQPSLMMTAKGASESGIGELMANVAGGVNMESAPGQPNRMGQGLGNLMMSRQAPQPAGMAQGGVVGKFAEGGNPLVEYYKQDLPAFQEILAPSQQDKDAAKRQLFFDIAQRGLAMAGGAGGTGNVASQLANVFQTLPGTYAAQQAELRKGERAAQQAALQSAAGRVGADREQQAKQAEMAEKFRLQGLELNQKFIYDMTVENAKARNKGLEFEGVIAVDSNGKPISDGGIFNMKDPADVRRMQQFQAGRQDVTFTELPKFSDLSSSGTAPDIKRLKLVDGSTQTIDISTASGAASYRNAMQQGAQEMGVEVPDVEVPELTTAQVDAVFADNDFFEALRDGKITDSQLTRLNAAIAQKTQPRSTTTGRILEGNIPEVVMTQESLPEQWLPVIRAARARGTQVQMPNGVADTSATAGAGPAPLASPTPQGDNPLAVSYDQQVQDAPILTVDQIRNVELPNFDDKTIGSESAVMGYPIDKLFGTWASFDRTWNTYGPAFLGLAGSEAALAAAPSQAEADAEAGLEAFKVLVVESMMAARGDKASNQLRDQLGALFPDINSAFTNPVDAAGKYKIVRNEMQKDVRMVEDQLKKPLTAKDKTNYEFVLRELADRLQELNTIVTQLEKATPGGQGTPPSDYDDIFAASTRVPYR
jgi:hypothetical protein